MAKLATFIVATVAGGILGIIGVVAAFGAVSPSADTVAEQTSSNQVIEVYGTR